MVFSEHCSDPAHVVQAQVLFPCRLLSVYLRGVGLLAAGCENVYIPRLPIPGPTFEWLPVAGMTECGGARPHDAFWAGGHGGRRKVRATVLPQGLQGI